MLDMFDTKLWWGMKMTKIEQDEIKNRYRIVVTSREGFVCSSIVSLSPKNVWTLNVTAESVLDYRKTTKNEE